MNKPEKARLQKILTTHLKEIHEIYTDGNFREESFYPSLKDLFENCSQVFSEEEEAGVLVLPKRTEVGIPDFLIRKDGEIVGHIEAKVPDANLREIENSEQIQRYRNALPNLIVNFWPLLEATKYNLCGGDFLRMGHFFNFTQEHIKRCHGRS